MQATTPISLLLKHKGADVWTIGPDLTVLDAIGLMAEKNVGAIPVVDGGKLVGMISERDYTRKVILRGRASRETRVAEIMSRDAVTIAPGATVHDCMEVMTRHRVRHLPVLEEGRLVGIVSIGDVVNWIITEQTHEIRHLKEYIAGSYPG